MKKLLLIFAAMVLMCMALAAQDFSQFKALDDSVMQDNPDYSRGNRYQKDALLFLDMLADTHPYYIKAERREALLAGRGRLLEACGNCTADSEFVRLLIETLGDLHDGHTDVIDPKALESARVAAASASAGNDGSAAGLMSRKDNLFHYVIVPENSVCYLQFNQCMDARTTGDASMPRWDLMLEEMFAAMKAQGIRALVVDAQYNNGGSSMLCDELLVRLCPLSRIRTLTTFMRFSNLLAAYNPRIGVAKQAWEADGHVDELYRMPSGNVSPEFVQPEVFDGKVIFVQGEKTYSSAGILMTLARDNHIGTIVGCESRFSPSHYGEVLPYRLPNTGILGTISCKFFARPDEAHIDDKTLVPDVQMDLSHKDRAWESILKLIAED